MTLLFDGSAKPADVRVGTNGPFGSWKNLSCTPQTDSISVQPAPGGRSGYAFRFISRPGSAYNCGGEQHNLIANYLPAIPSVHNDVWYGWSQYLDRTWQPGSLYLIGIGESFQTGAGALPGAGIKIGTAGTSMNIEMYLNGVAYVIPGKFQIDIWEDWMYHVKWRTDNTGFFEVFKNGKLVLSRYGIVTKTTSYGDFGHKLGMYRPAPNYTTQIVYILAPKIGTTRADVEYISGVTPFETPIPTPQPTPVPTPIPTPQPGSYQIIISPLGSGTVTTRVDANLTIFTATAKPGFRFDHWLDVWPNGREESMLNPWADAITSTDVITAFFTPTLTPIPTPVPTPGPTPIPQDVTVISLDINSNPIGAKIIVNGVAVN